MLPSRSSFRPPAHRGYPDAPQASQAVAATAGTPATTYVLALDPPSALALHDPSAIPVTSLSHRTVQPGDGQQGDGKASLAQAGGAKRKTRDEPPEQGGVQTRDSKIARSGTHTDPTTQAADRRLFWQQYQQFLGYSFAPGDESRQLSNIVSSTIGRLGGMHISDADLSRVLDMMYEAQPDVAPAVAPIADALGGSQMPLRRLEVFVHPSFISADVLGVFLESNTRLLDRPIHQMLDLMLDWRADLPQRSEDVYSDQGLPGCWTYNFFLVYFSLKNDQTPGETISYLFENAHRTKDEVHLATLVAACFRGHAEDVVLGPVLEKMSVLTQPQRHAMFQREVIRSTLYREDDDQGLPLILAAMVDCWTRMSPEVRSEFFDAFETCIAQEEMREHHQDMANALMRFLHTRNPAPEIAVAMTCRLAHGWKHDPELSQLQEAAMRSFGSCAEPTNPAMRLAFDAGLALARQPAGIVVRGSLSPEQHDRLQYFWLQMRPPAATLAIIKTLPLSRPAARELAAELVAAARHAIDRNHFQSVFDFVAEGLGSRTNRLADVRPLDVRAWIDEVHAPATCVNMGDSETDERSSSSSSSLLRSPASPSSSSSAPAAQSGWHAADLNYQRRANAFAAIHEHYFKAPKAAEQILTLLDDGFAIPDTLASSGAHLRRHIRDCEQELRSLAGRQDLDRYPRLLASAPIIAAHAICVRAFEALARPAPPAASLATVPATKAPSGKDELEPRAR